MKLFLYSALLLAINANEDKYEPRWDFQLLTVELSESDQSEALICVKRFLVKNMVETACLLCGRNKIKREGGFSSCLVPIRHGQAAGGSGGPAWTVQGFRAFRSWNSGHLIGREHFENPSYRESIQKAEMASLAETVSSAIIERHPEIGTLKKINEVKEYIDDGAISKGKVVHRVFEDVPDVVGRTVRHSTLSLWVPGKICPWKTLSKNG